MTIKKVVQYSVIGLLGVIGTAALAWAACSELCKQMTTMNYEIKMFIDPGISHPELNAQTLVHIKELRIAAVASHDLIPDKAAGDPKLIAEYQADIDLLVSQINKMAIALGKNDNVSALRILNDIKSLKLDGHKKFKPESNN